MCNSRYEIRWRSGFFFAHVVLDKKWEPEHQGYVYTVGNIADRPNGERLLKVANHSALPFRKRLDERLARLEQEKLLLCVTQNTDGLHLRSVIKKEQFSLLHGNWNLL